MRLFVAALIASLAAAPAIAAPRHASPAKPAPIALPPELSDPALADKLGRVTGALAKAMLDMPVGEMEAAIENRPATPADRARKVRDVTGMDERTVAAETAASGKTMQAMTKALVASLPAILASMDGARKELEKAAANLPDPTYPKR